MVQVFLRSLLMGASASFRGGQNLGFSFSLLPLVGSPGMAGTCLSSFLIRHLQIFRSHPSLYGPVVGAVSSMEEAAEGRESDRREVKELKDAFMGPYAASGNSFFSAALRPCASGLSILLAFQPFSWAFVAFIALYHPAYLWIRIGGFIEGYRRGKDIVGFMEALDLPRLTGSLQTLLLVLSGGIASVAGQAFMLKTMSLPILFLGRILVLAFILLSLLGLKQGMSRVTILYAVFFFSWLIYL